MNVYKKLSKADFKSYTKFDSSSTALGKNKQF